MLRNKKNVGIVAIVVCLSAAAIAVHESKADSADSRSGSTSPEPQAAAKPAAAQDSVAITDLQAKQVKIVTAQQLDFVAQREAVGYIDFNQDRTVPVFSPYQGRVRQVFAKAGDDVRKGQTLFSVDTPHVV